MESGLTDKADSLADQMRAIVHEVMPELDMGRDEFGKWQVGLDNYLNTLNKSAGGTAKELKETRDRIAEIKDELTKGESLEEAIKSLVEKVEEQGEKTKEIDEETLRRRADSSRVATKVI